MDRDSISKAFQSRIVLGKMNIVYITTAGHRRDQDYNDESALKVEPNHQCLQPHVQQLFYNQSINQSFI